jgi:hypothetical protein
LEKIGSLASAKLCVNMGVTTSALLPLNFEQLHQIWCQVWFEQFHQVFNVIFIASLTRKI